MGGGGSQRRMQRQALLMQQRQMRAMEEQAALARAEDPTQQRAMRGAGRRALAFMGSELGVSSSLAGA